MFFEQHEEYAHLYFSKPMFNLSIEDYSIQSYISKNSEKWTNATFYGF